MIFPIFHFFNLSFLSVKRQKIVQNEWKIKISHVQYLRNSIAYDHDFWYKYVKYLQIFIFIVSKFWFFGLLWVTGQKMAQNDKNSVTPHFSGNISYDCHLWYAYEEWQYLPAFFSCFQNFYFPGFRRVKGQTLVQNDKKVSPLRNISQKPYIV